MESERHKPRAGQKPIHGSTRLKLDRTGATRDTSAEQLHKHKGDQTGMWYIHSPKCIICSEELEDCLCSAGPHQTGNWMEALGHAINEVVSLYRCGCGQSYKEWGDRPTPPCPTCEKTRLRKTGPGKRGRESEDKTEKRTKCEDRTDEGKTEKNETPQETKQNSTSHALPNPTPDPQM